MACQFLEAARKDLPDLDSRLEAGDFGPLKSWLNREVRDGRRVLVEACDAVSVLG